MWIKVCSLVGELSSCHHLLNFPTRLETAEDAAKRTDVATRISWRQL